MKSEEFNKVLKEKCVLTCRACRTCDLFGTPDYSQDTIVTVRIGDTMKKNDYKKLVKWFMEICPDNSLTISEMDEMFTNYVYDMYEDIYFLHPEQVNTLTIALK